MATGTYVERPGGFSLKSEAQLFTRRQKVILGQNMVDISTAGLLSCRALHTGGITSSLADSDGATGFTNQTPVTTETYWCEIVIPYAVSVTGIAFINGSDVTGNTMGAIADASGAVIAVTLPTAGSGTDAYQRIALVGGPFLLPKGTYFVGRQQSSATSRIAAHTVGNFATYTKTGETAGTITNFTPPSTFTTAIGPLASLY